MWPKRDPMEEYAGYGRTIKQGPLRDFVAASKDFGATHVFVNNRFGRRDAYAVKGNGALLYMLKKFRTALDKAELYDLANGEVERLNPQETRADFAVKAECG